eukprot:GHUV01029901.1.p1 GENE.GHUV01029901.1~~GHUV01029901.1.p1  ORF type:complete len:113 (-),score=22.72 GHUV01029901.1:333-671(-)
MHAPAGSTTLAQTRGVGPLMAVTTDAMVSARAGQDTSAAGESAGPGTNLIDIKHLVQQVPALRGQPRYSAVVVRVLLPAGANLLYPDAVEACCVDIILIFHLKRKHAQQHDE